MSVVSQPQYNRIPWPDEHLAQIARVGKGRSAHCLFGGDRRALCGGEPSEFSGVGWMPHYLMIGIACARCVDAWRTIMRGPWRGRA